MRTYSLSLLAAALLATGAATAAPANPLIRPNPVAGRTPQPGMPPVPPAPGIQPTYTPGMPGMPSAPGAEDSVAKSAQRVAVQLGAYTVVVISGDTAVLRTVSGSGASAEPSPTVAPGMPPAAASAAAANPTSMSFVVQNKNSLMIQDVKVMPEVSSNQVTLRAEETGRTLFFGRLEGASHRAPMGLKIEAADPNYVTRQSLASGLTVAGGGVGTSTTNNGGGTPGAPAGR